MKTFRQVSLFWVLLAACSLFVDAFVHPDRDYFANIFVHANLCFPSLI